MGGRFLTSAGQRAFDQLFRARAGAEGDLGPADGRIGVSLFVAQCAQGENGVAEGLDCDELERATVAEFFQRAFGQDLPESAARLRVS